MADVTCKAAHTFLDVVAARGVAPARLAATSRYSLEYLRDKNNRISWAEFVELGRAMRSLCNLTDEDLENVGREAFKSGPLRVVMSVGRVVGEPARFYKWMQRGNAMLFANMTSTVEVHAKNHVSIRIQLRDGDEQSTEYLAVSKGAIASMPTLLGYPEAIVTLALRGREAVFDVVMRPKRRSFARRAFNAFRGSEETADELLATNNALTTRLAELADANERIVAQAMQLEEQAARLRLANEVSALIHGSHDLQDVLDRIAVTLTTNTPAVGVALEARASTGVRHARCGDPTTHEITSAIVARSSTVGTLRLFTRSGLERDELETRLEYLLPVLGMAIDDALAYEEIAAYRTDLERLVDRRTAELQQAHDELAATVTQLRDAQDAREKFFGNISHEIRTPLSLIVLAAADIARRAGHVLDDRARDELGTVTESARKLVRLVDELLLLAAGQQDKLAHSPEPTDLAALLVQLRTAWRPAAEAGRLDIDVHAPPSLVVHGDPIALERVVSNLISNAVKYTPPGGRLDVELESTAEAVRISVLDTGTGIDADLAARLFGRFERATDENRSKPGTGIGLALVKQLVEAHGGTVAAHARATGGTELRVLLPSSILIDNVGSLPPTHLRTTHVPEPTSTITSGTEFSPPGLAAGTIMVVDDHPHLAESIATLLAEDYKVVVALDGQAALELVAQHRPQLLVTDVEMPGMNGIELSRRFRELTADPLAPIIILSAVIDLRTRVAGLDAGATDYVTKPFDPVELRARVDAQFRMRDLAMRLHRAEQLSSMSVLTSGLAHELRNPANGIVNAIAPLVDLLPPELLGPDSDAGQLIEAMKSSADQIAFLVRQLLGFRRSTRLEMRPCDLASLVQRAVGLAKQSVVAVDVRIDMAVEHRVSCAQPLLVQVLANLVENAAHAAGPGGWLHIRGRSGEGRVTVEVSDSGPGVPIELRERVFEPFFTTKAPGRGTGMGLSVARDIVHRHGGTLEIRDREGASVFVIDLPAEPTSANRANAV